MPQKNGNPPTTHTVASGDTLFDIAEVYYGDGNLWTKIQAANNNQDPKTLQVGQILQIPVLHEPPEPRPRPIPGQPPHG